MTEPYVSLGLVMFVSSRVLQHLARDLMYTASQAIRLEGLDSQALCTHTILLESWQTKLFCIYMYI